MSERILVGGSPGTGKTYQWLTIARAFPNVTFHVIDPDDGVSRLVETEFSELTNLDYYFTPVWYSKPKANPSGFGKVGGIADSFAEIRKAVKPGDWLIIEMLGNIWSMAQTAFVTEVFDQGIGEYFLNARKSMKEGAKRLEALKGWTDWQVINKMHNDDFLVPACYQVGCHVYMTSSVSVSAPTEVAGEDAEVRSFYGDSLIRFDGQKQNPFRAQSIFLFRKDRKGQWRYSTFIKDRGRQFIEDEELYDFGVQYVMGIAGIE